MSMFDAVFCVFCPIMVVGAVLVFLCRLQENYEAEKKRNADKDAEKAKTRRTTMDDNEKNEITRLCRKVMAWLADPKHAHPHTKVIIESNRFEVVEGTLGYRSDDFLGAGRPPEPGQGQVVVAKPGLAADAAGVSDDGEG